MWQELFVNACILITVIFITSQIFKNTGISKNSPTNVKIMLGILGGISASLLIHFSIHITSRVVSDFRDLCIILVAMFGGLFPTLITGLITMTFRLSYGSISWESILFAFEILIVSIGCGAFSQTRYSEKIKCSVMLLYCLVIRSLAYFIVLEDRKNAILVIASTWITFTILGIGIYYFAKYLVTAHLLLKNLKKESSQDFLTGLSNTRQFDRKYKAILQHTLDIQGILSLLIIDIDHFKSVNDRYGHVVGDTVLKELGRVLKITCKEYYMVSRIGGEEFAVVLKDLNKEQIAITAERIRATVEAHSFNLPGGKKMHINISIGVAIYPDTVENIENLRDISDKKLYEAKRTGRNKVCI